MKNLRSKIFNHLWPPYNPNFKPPIWLICVYLTQTITSSILVIWHKETYDLVISGLIALCGALLTLLAVYHRISIYEKRDLSKPNT